MMYVDGTKLLKLKSLSGFFFTAYSGLLMILQKQKCPVPFWNREKKTIPNPKTTTTTKSPP